MPGWTRSFSAARYLSRRLAQFNPSGRSRRNVAHHYDIDGAIYDLFLDSDRQYSCAYFTEGADLEEAQLAKKRHLAAKLAIEPGQRVLDIGSGWGGLGLYLAKAAHCDVTGVTLSNEQLKISRERAAREGLSRAVHFEFEDYRKVEGRFDRIVSVGMFEHVGVNHYARLLPQAARAADRRRRGADPHHRPLRAAHRHQSVHRQVHLPRRLHPGAVGDGGRHRALRASSSPTSRSCACTTPRRCAPGASASSPTGTRPPPSRTRRFCRMWEFYLAASETAFRYQDLVVFQVQLAKRIKALPITRDYMYKAERACSASTTASAPPHGRRVTRRHPCAANSPAANGFSAHVVHCGDDCRLTAAAARGASRPIRGYASRP